MISERRDCRERKCTTYRQERNVGQSEGWYQREGTVGKGSVRPIDKHPPHKSRNNIVHITLCRTTNVRHTDTKQVRVPIH